MKILETYKDGSRTILFEPGDRVVFPEDVNGGGFLGAKAGEHATVISREDRPDGKYPSIQFLRVQTDAMRAGGWGVITVAPWDCELEEGI